MFAIWLTENVECSLRVGSECQLTGRLKGHASGRERCTPRGLSLQGFPEVRRSLAVVKFTGSFTCIRLTFLRASQVRLVMGSSEPVVDNKMNNSSELEKFTQTEWEESLNNGAAPASLTPLKWSQEMGNSVNKHELSPFLCGPLNSLGQLRIPPDASNGKMTLGDLDCRPKRRF